MKRFILFLLAIGFTSVMYAGNGNHGPDAKKKDGVCVVEGGEGGCKKTDECGEGCKCSAKKKECKRGDRPHHDSRMGMNVGGKHKHKRGKKGRKMLSPEERAAKMTKRLDKIVDLSAEQEQKVLALNLSKMEKMKANMETNAGDHEAMKKETKKIRKKYKKKLKRILTKEQEAKLEAKKKEMRGKKHAGKKQKCATKKSGCCAGH